MITTNLKHINYFFIGFILLWSPIQMAFLHIDGKGRIMFFFVLLVFLINLLIDKDFSKKYLFSKPTVFWVMWVIFSSINLKIQGSQEIESLLFFIVLNLFKPLLALLITQKEINRNKESLLKFLTVTFFIYAVFSVTILTNNVTIDRSQRFLGSLGNDGPLTSLFVIFFLGLLYVNGWINLKKLAPLFLIIFLIIIFSGTRKAFGAAIIITTTIIIAHLKLTARNLVTIIFLIGTLYIGYNYAMKNTSMGERFEHGVESGEEVNTTDIKALNFLGDRATFYILGWKVFTENQFTGIGLRNYMRETGSDFVIHSEYMVQLAEGGIIGTCLFLLFYIGIGKRLYKSLRKQIYYRSINWVLMGGFIAILFLSLTTWTYAFVHYFIVLGVIMGYSQSQNLEYNLKILSANKYV